MVKCTRPLFDRSEVEQSWKEAIEFTNKLLTHSLANSDNLYQSYLLLMEKYHRSATMDTATVHEGVRAIFAGHPEFLQGFNTLCVTKQFSVADPNDQRRRPKNKTLKVRRPLTSASENKRARLIARQIVSTRVSRPPTSGTALEINKVKRVSFPVARRCLRNRPKSKFVYKPPIRKREVEGVEPPKEMNKTKPRGAKLRRKREMNKTEVEGVEPPKEMNKTKPRGYRSIYKLRAKLRRKGEKRDERKLRDDIEWSDEPCTPSYRFLAKPLIRPDDPKSVLQVLNYTCAIAIQEVASRPRRRSKEEREMDKREDELYMQDMNRMRERKASESQGEIKLAKRVCERVCPVMGSKHCSLLFSIN